MEAVRVTKDKEWLKAGVYFVRTQAMCFGFDVPLEMEFEDDTAEQEYILVLDDGKPVSTCRVSVEEGVGHVERVATLESYRGKHFGAAGIVAAEQWLKEKGVKKIAINSREAALGFYEKLGYVADHTQVSGSGEFRCIMTTKTLD